MDKETLKKAEVILNLCKENKLHLACAESCTGGLIAAALTELSGSSDYFLGGIVSYTESIKETVLGVNKYIINKYGVVSHETARAMAQAVRLKTGADIAVSTTGIAGPTGAEPGKPIGTVFYGLASAKDTKSFLTCKGVSRQDVRKKAVHYALDLIINEIK